MTPASTFARYFARLIALRIHDPNIEAHRAVVAHALAANPHGVTMTWDNWQVRVGDDTLTASPDTLDLLTRMAAHGVRELSFSVGIKSEHVLGVAGILCQEPNLGDGGVLAMSRLSSMLDAPGVRMTTVLASATPAPEPVLASEPPAVATVALVHRAPASHLASRRRAQHDTAEVLIARLTEAKTIDQIARATDALVALAEFPHKRISDVAMILTALIREEARFTDQESKRLFGFAIKRIGNSSTLRAMAGALVSMPDKRDALVSIFEYFGAAAADQIIEQLATSDSLRERRLFYDLTIELNHGVPTLICLLGDDRWYVVRNAAELLGEMRATEAEQALAWRLNHPDARVRRSVTTALAKFDTTGARAALRDATRDTSPDVRMNALLALLNGDRERVATEIIRALLDERDPDSQRTSMIILVRLGTPEALQYVLDAAEPEKGFFKKKPTSTRVAAVAALADATDPTALATIRAMTKDKELEVRDAAARALTAAEARAATMTSPEASWSNPTPDRSDEAAA